MRRIYIRLPLREPFSGKYRSAVKMPTNPLLLLVRTGYFLDLVGFDHIAFVQVVESFQV